MKFRVIWAPEAEDQLAKSLAAALDPDQLVAAANLIDRKLISDPLKTWVNLAIKTFEWVSFIHLEFNSK